MGFRRIIAAAVLVCAALPAHAAGLGWRVVGDAGAAMYLVGTIHAADESFYPLPAAIDDAFARADVLVVEVDMSRVDPREAAEVSRRYGLLPPDRSLRTMLGNERWRQVVAWGRRVGVTERTLDRMQPWYAAITLVSLDMRRLGLDPALGMERHLGERAATRGMDVEELETVVQQFSALSRLPRDAQVAFLDGSLGTSAELAASVERIVGSWRRGDVEGMAGVLTDAYTDPAVYDVLIRRRHDAWMPELERMLASGRVHFVAVGALHLVGDDGLVRLLEERGYRLERL